jgi:hypothetical protein
MTPITKPSRAVQLLAQALLNEWRAAGLAVEGHAVIEYADGVPYLFKAKWHAPGARNGKRHIGVTVYPADADADGVVYLPEVAIHGFLPNGDGTLLAVPGLERNTTHDDRVAIIEMCERLGAVPDHMVTCMSFESGSTFDPAVRNAAGSSAVGLIQFMAATAKALGTTTAALGGMTVQQQLAYVEKYFAPYRNTTALRTLEGTYLCIFYPRARLMKPHEVVARVGTVAYTQNKGLDRDRDGDIEVQEICSTIVKHAAKANGRRIPV